MRRIILVLVLCLITSNVYAQSWLIYNNTTKEVYSLSNEDDCVMPKSGYTKIILKEDLKDIQLNYHPIYYKWDGKFIANIKKLSDEANAQIQAEEKAKEEKKVQEEMRNIAIKSLKEKGVEFKYIGTE